MPKQKEKQRRKPETDRDGEEGVLRQTGSGHGKDSDPPLGRNSAGKINRPASR